MVEQERMDKFYQFIRVIMERINAHFENQKEYIHCKEGCSFCCEKGEYPCSELEFEFLKIGFMTLDRETQQKIVDETIKLKEEKAKVQSNIEKMAQKYLEEQKKEKMKRYLKMIFTMLIIGIMVTVIVLNFKIYGVIGILTIMLFYNVFSGERHY